MGSADPGDDVAARTRWPAPAQPAGQRLTDIGRQREPFLPATLAADDDLTGPPVQVRELQSCDLARPQAQSGQQRQDREVPAAEGRAPIAAGQ